MANDTALEPNVSFVIVAGECRTKYMYIVVGYFAAEDTGFCQYWRYAVYYRYTYE